MPKNQNLPSALWYASYKGEDLASYRPLLSAWNNKNIAHHDESERQDTEATHAKIRWQDASSKKTALSDISLEEIAWGKSDANFKSTILKTLTSELVFSGTKDTQTLLEKYGKSASLELRAIFIEKSDDNSATIQIVVDFYHILNLHNGQKILNSNGLVIATVDTKYKLTSKINHISLAILEHYELTRHPAVEAYLGWQKPSFFKQLFTTSYIEPEILENQPTTTTDIIATLNNTSTEASSIQPNPQQETVCNQNDDGEDRLLSKLNRLMNEMITEANQKEPNYIHLNEKINDYYKEKEIILKKLEILEMLNRPGIKPNRFKLLEENILLKLDFQNPMIINLFNAVSVVKTSFSSAIPNEKLDCVNKGPVFNLFDSLLTHIKQQDLFIVEKLRAYDIRPIRHKKGNHRSALEIFTTEAKPEDLIIQTTEAQQIEEKLNSYS